jgi:hypothetical protein
MIRPTVGIEGSRLQYTVKARYKFNLAEITAAAGDAAAISGVAWDTAVWDSAVWGANTYDTKQQVLGASGIGPEVAVAMRGDAISRTVIIKFDLVLDQGGFL